MIKNVLNSLDKKSNYFKNNFKRTKVIRLVKSPCYTLYCQNLNDYNNE